MHITRNFQSVNELFQRETKKFYQELKITPIIAFCNRNTIPTPSLLMFKVMNYYWNKQKLKTANLSWKTLKIT